MCGRFIVFSERDAAEVLLEMNVGRLGGSYEGRDAYPKNTAPVFIERQGLIGVESLGWGFPMSGKKQVIFNARAETIEEKPLFRRAFEGRRCVIPSLGFYEWSRDTKESFRFNMERGELLFMAGVAASFEDRDFFTIVTSPANASVSPVHHRMPLVLGADYALDWIRDPVAASELLTLPPPELRRVRS